ncbi:MAG: response regulator [Acidobacteriota bacterium]
MPHRLGVPKHAEPTRLATRGHVLVVDEDRGDLVYYRTVLQRMGCAVVTCGSYDEALDCLKSQPFDLVVLSQGSPAFEGRNVLESALAIDRDRSVLVVARSLDMGCYLEAMQLGARDYLEEPVPEKDLVRAAETCLGSRAVAA